MAARALSGVLLALPLAVLLYGAALASFSFIPGRRFAWKVAGGSGVMVFAIMTAPCVDLLFLHPEGELNYCPPRMVVFLDPFINWSWANYALNR